MLIAAFLEMPEIIAAGIASGQLERVGGVIRDVASKQVVAWLREGAEISANQDIAGGMLKTLLQASGGGLASAATGAFDVAVTARSHFLIMQQLQRLTSLVGVVGGLGVLGIAATAISTAILLERLRDLDKKIVALQKQISREFSRDRHVKLEAAIDAATEALQMDSANNRSFQAKSALNRLSEARLQIWREVESLKGTSRTSENNQLMQGNILQAMQLDFVRVRCLFEINELSRAKEYLRDKLEEYREVTRLLIHRFLGEHRAVYFHKSVSEDELCRYLAIEQWLRNRENILLEVLLAYRHDLWNQDILKYAKIVPPKKARRRGALSNRSKDSSVDKAHLDALTQSELIIENYERVQGFCAEIEAIERLGINCSDWELQQNKALAEAKISLDEYNDYVLLVDRDYIKSAERLSQ